MGNSDSIEDDDIVIESQNANGSFVYSKSSLLNLESNDSSSVKECSFVVCSPQSTTTPTLTRKNSLNYFTKCRRPSLEFYDCRSPKLQPFPSAQLLSDRKRSHSESSVFRRRIFRDSSKIKLNGKLSWMQASKMRIDQLFKKSHSSSKKRLDINNYQLEPVHVETVKVQPCVQCKSQLIKHEWKEKLEKWAESLRQAIAIINREEKMRLFIQSLQSENSYLKNQLDNINLDYNELKNKYDLFEHEAIMEKSREEQDGHLFCHHCMNNNHLNDASNSLCHLLDLDNLTSELNTILTCEKCCQTCQTIAGQLLKRLHF